jgi:Mg/Co/Ni transporter MgtE
MATDEISEPTEGERARRGLVLGALLGVVLAVLGRRSVRRR